MTKKTHTHTQNSTHFRVLKSYRTVLRVGFTRSISHPKGKGRGVLIYQLLLVIVWRLLSGFRREEALIPALLVWVLRARESAQTKKGRERAVEDLIRAHWSGEGKGMGQSTNPVPHCRRGVRWGVWVALSKHPNSGPLTPLSTFPSLILPGVGDGPKLAKMFSTTPLCMSYQ